MKLTKGMKKALSLLLTGALAISGANTGVLASAEEANSVTIDFTNTDGGWKNNTGSVNVTESGDYTIDVDVQSADVTSLVNVGYFTKVTDENVESLTVELKSIVVNGETELKLTTPTGAMDLLEKNVDLLNIWTYNKEETASFAYAKSEDETAVLESGDFSTHYKKDKEGNPTEEVDGIYSDGITFKVNDEATVITSLSYKFTATVEFKAAEEPETPVNPSEPASPGAGDVDPSKPVSPGAGDVDPSKPVSPGAGDVNPDEPVVKEPVVNREAGDMNEFDIDLTYVSDGWSEKTDEGNAVTVDGNGDYEINYTAQSDTPNIFMLWLTTNLHDNTFPADFKIQATEIVIGDATYALDNSDGYMCFADGKYDSVLRVNIKNEYNGLYEEDFHTTIDGTVPVDATKIGDATKGATMAVKAGDVVTVKFTVSGMNPEAPTVNFTEKYPSKDDENKDENKDNNTNTNTNTNTGNKVTTPSGISTPATIASPATAKIKVAKKNKNVVVKAGKSKSVKFTAVADEPATSAAVVTATVKKNKKVTAKVVGGKVKITAKKKAVKGSTAKVVLTSTNASGTAVKTTINVAVQNKAKKVKAAKKKVTIKKGKKAKVVIKVTKAENKKKAVTDKVTAKIKKIAKVQKTQIKKGKIILTLKAKKKGSAKMTVKVGSIKKKVKINVKVK